MTSAQTYKPCCFSSAKDLKLARCLECGTRLVRCMSFTTCGALIDPGSPIAHCGTCVQPVVSLDCSAMRPPKTGEQLALNFVFENPPSAKRTLTCEQIEFFLNGDNVPVAIGWADVEAGGQRRFTVSTPPLERAGGYSLRLLLTLTTRNDKRAEHYVFETYGQIDVNDAGSAAGPQVVISGAVSDNALINITGLTSPAQQEKSGTAALIQSRLQRADLLERQRGLRGLGVGHGRLRLDASFRFMGFNDGDCPPQNSGIGGKGSLSFGRASRAYHPQNNPQPSDISIPIYQADNTTVDEEASLRISRRHFDLLIMNDRLYAAVISAGGIDINGEHLTQHTLRALCDNDTIVLTRNIEKSPAIRVQFEGSQNDVDMITLVRTTADKAKRS